jgi:hypothetical protein
MSDLDKKLEDAFNEVGECFYWEGAGKDEDWVNDFRKDFREKLKQAFIDTGWISKDQSTKEAQDTANFMINIKDKALNKMTGQEWYDKFEKEQQGTPIPCDNSSADDVIRAVELVKASAKKAAGIE